MLIQTLQRHIKNQDHQAHIIKLVVSKFSSKILNITTFKGQPKGEQEVLFVPITLLLRKKISKIY